MSAGHSHGHHGTDLHIPAPLARALLFSVVPFAVIVLVGLAALVAVGNGSESQ